MHDYFVEPSVSGAGRITRAASDGVRGAALGHAAKQFRQGSKNRGFNAASFALYSGAPTADIQLGRGSNIVGE